MQGAKSVGLPGPGLEQGRGVAKDDKEAVVWYKKAANQGNATAQSNLGVMSAAGRGGD